MVRHFEKKSAAVKFRDEQRAKFNMVSVFKKVKGQKNRVKKPFVVCSDMEWLNLY